MTSVLAWCAGSLGAAAVACMLGGPPQTKRLPPEIAPQPTAGSSPVSWGTRRRSLRGWHAVALGLVLALIAPALAPVPLAVMVVLPRLDELRRRRRHVGAVIDQLPDLVDLLRLTTLAGLPVSAALGAISDRPGGVVGPAVARSVRLLDRGATTAQALAALGEACGSSARSLIDALADHDRYGTPLGPSLERVAVECRLRRRRRAEEAARRLPVMLLFPLILTTLPAFVLLTILPILVGSFSTLRL